MSTRTPDTNRRGSGGESLADQRERLAALESLEREIRSLRDGEGTLEVERIAADAALRAAGAAPAGLDAARGAALGEALEHRHGLESARDRLRASTSGGGERLREARAALAAWLDSWELRPARTPPAMRWLMAAFALLSLAAALAVHLAFLVLLFPLAGAVSFLTWRGQDADFERIGAERRFARTGLSPPARWERDPVRERLERIDAAIDAAARDRAETPGFEDPEALEAALAEAEIAVASALLEARLDPADLSPEVARWITLAAGARRAAAGLDAHQARLRGAKAEADGLREHLFRYLSRHDAAPADGRADTAALAAGLEKIK